MCSIEGPLPPEPPHEGEPMPKGPLRAFNHPLQPTSTPLERAVPQDEILANLRLLSENAEGISLGAKCSISTISSLPYPKTLKTEEEILAALQPIKPKKDETGLQFAARLYFAFLSV